MLIRGVQTNVSHYGGSNAARREDRKLAHYEKEKHPGGLSVRVVPLALKHFGRWGKKAETYLDELSKQSKDDFGNQTDQSLKTIGIEELPFTCNVAMPMYF